jgi:hypothetical protein
MIQSITRLFGIPVDPTVTELALLLSDIEVALIDKSITEQEYVALMVDVERLRSVIKKTGRAEWNQLIHQSVTEIINLAAKVF